jgi:hypothetical protein
MSAFNLLHPDHMMAGIDLHDAIMPPSLKKIPSVPHIVSAKLRGSVAGTGYAGTVKHAPKVQVYFADALQRSTDIGWAIPHVQYNFLLPGIIADSKSKSEFEPRLGAHEPKPHARPLRLAAFGADPAEQQPQSGVKLLHRLQRIINASKLSRPIGARSPGLSHSSPSEGFSPTAASDVSRPGMVRPQPRHTSGTSIQYSKAMARPRPTLSKHDVLGSAVDRHPERTAGNEPWTRGTEARSQRRRSRHDDPRRCIVLGQRDHDPCVPTDRVDRSLAGRWQGRKRHVSPRPRRRYSIAMMALESQSGPCF